MNVFQRILSYCIIGIYILVACLGIWLAFVWQPPVTTDEWKDFGVRAGVLGTLISGILGVVVSLYSLHITRDNERIKGQVLRQTESYKKVLELADKNYHTVMLSANTYYYELNRLAEGKMSDSDVRSIEKKVEEARTYITPDLEKDYENFLGDGMFITDLASVLQKMVARDGYVDADKKIEEIYNLLNKYDIPVMKSKSALKMSPKALPSAYRKLWQAQAVSFGKALETLGTKLRQRLTETTTLPTTDQ